MHLPDAGMQCASRGSMRITRCQGVRRIYPFLDFKNPRFPIRGGLLQPRGGTVRHDAVAWGYARAADVRGVDIIQHCEVTGIRIASGKVIGVETTRGFIKCNKLGLAAAGNSSEVAAMAGIRLPIESHVAAGLRVRKHQTIYRWSHYFRRWSLLCLAVRQRRTRVWRGPRRIQFVRSARKLTDG